MRSSFRKACNELYSSGKFSDLKIPIGLFYIENIGLHKIDQDKQTKINNAKKP